MGGCFSHRNGKGSRPFLQRTEGRFAAKILLFEKKKIFF